MKIQKKKPAQKMLKYFNPRKIPEVFNTDSTMGK
jgi:hypothetical protein